VNDGFVAHDELEAPATEPQRPPARLVSTLSRRGVSTCVANLPVANQIVRYEIKQHCNAYVIVRGFIVLMLIAALSCELFSYFRCEL